jgi:hypothetical protein
MEVASESSPSPANTPRVSDYEHVKRRATTWLDELEVDPVELIKHRVKGKKKLAEILGVYLDRYRHTSDSAGKAAIRSRLEQLAQHVRRPEYHNMLTNSDVEFKQNSMSYLRVLWLLERFGMDFPDYRDHIHAVTPRMNKHFETRGPWQLTMFGKYYEHFGLKKPSLLFSLPMQQGVIAQKLPVKYYNRNISYHLTHEIYVAFDYGSQLTQSLFDREDLDYLRTVLPSLVSRYIGENNADLVAELLSCMTYLGLHSIPAYQESINYLLASQNHNGSWGNHEAYRHVYGEYLDQHRYLHTTSVVLRALMEVYEGNWPSSG